MFASLPMYDLPELREETDALWSAVARRLRARDVEAPDHLSRPTRFPEDWLRPDLILSQTCGLPYVRRLRGRVALVAAVDYDLADCPPGTYRSRIIVREDDPARDFEGLRGRVAAINSPDSQSGFGALRSAVGPLRRDAPFFARVIQTGAHLESLRAVARGDADAAAIDAVTFALAQRHVPEAASVRVLASTPETPGLPLITRLGGPKEALFGAIEEAIDAIGPRIRSALLLRGIVPRHDEDFDGIASADAAGHAL